MSPVKLFVFDGILSLPSRELRMWQIYRLPSRPGRRMFIGVEGDRRTVLMNLARHRWWWTVTLPVGGADFRWTFDGHETTLREAVNAAADCHADYPPFDKPYDPPPDDPPDTLPPGGSGQGSALIKPSCLV